MIIKESLFGKNDAELKAVAQQCGMPMFAWKQMADWLYKKQVIDISQMTNISIKFREILESRYCIGRQIPLKEQVSTDGTKKYLFGSSHGLIETVYIPDNDRATVCVSSQAGCKMNCSFCLTGKQGFSGNLTAGEILNQIFSIPDSKNLTNIVFMGMGEPFDNTDAVLSALSVLTSTWGYAWSPRRITVSTIGVIPGMKRFIENSDCHLAVSLHNPFHNERMDMMPAEKAFPLENIIQTIRNYNIRGQRRISFEYIVFENFNDSIRHARELVRLLDGMNCRVNLIRFHSITNSEPKSPPQEKMEFFRDYLNENGVICTIRRSRGEDIAAACGLLSTTNDLMKNR